MAVISDVYVAVFSDISKDIICDIFVVVISNILMAVNSDIYVDVISDILRAVNNDQNKAWINYIYVTLMISVISL